MHYLRLAMISWLLLLWVAPVHAGTVAIVRSSSPSPESMEARSRVHGELLSVGLEVKLINRPTEAAADSQAWLEQIAAEGQIDAVVDIVGDSPVTADVWVIEKAPRRLERSRIVLESNTRNTAEMLAIRTVEVLRSTFLERDMATRQRQGESVATPLTQTTKAPVPASFPRRESQPQSVDLRRVGVELGAAMLTSFDGPESALLPLAGVDWSVRPEFMLQIAFAGLGTRPTLSTEEGSATVAQQYGLIGGSLALPSRRWFRTFLAVSAGTLHTRISGAAESPREAHSVDQWSLLSDWSLGARLRITDSYFLIIATHLQLAAPYVAIHIVDKVVATSGHPNLVLSLTVGAWL